MTAGSTLLRLAALALLWCVAGSAQAQAAPVQRSGYITMADGVQLRYAAVLPSAEGRFPVAMKYDGYCEGTSPLTCNDVDNAKSLLAAGYAIVGVAVRGTGCSQGTFEFRSPVESTDGKAAVEWAASQPWSTGRVGMFGTSFPGLMQPGVAALHPKGLAAIAPWQIVDDLYRDAAYPGGIANAEFAVLWALLDQLPVSTSSSVDGLTAGDPQCGLSLLHQLVTNPLNNIALTALLHPNIDPFWHERAVAAAADRIDVPALFCSTWQDDETGSRSMWTLWPRLDPKRTWGIAANGYHSMCVRSKRIGNDLVRFFDRFVKGERNGFDQTPRMQLWHETTNVRDATPAWVTTSDRWPPPTRTERLYLGQGGALTAAPPRGEQPADRYITHTQSAGTDSGVIFGQRNKMWKQPGDPAGAVPYTTPRLARDVELLGPLSLDMWIRPSRDETDLQATITEVRPDGNEVYVARGWLRASHRKLDARQSTETMPVQTHLASDVQTLVPGQVIPVRLEVLPFDHVFRAGSRIRLVIDSPSQTGGWNFLPGLLPGPNEILHDAAHPSRIVVGTVPSPVVPKGHSTCDTLLNQPCRPNAFPASAPAGRLDWPRVVAAPTSPPAAKPKRPRVRIAHLRVRRDGLRASGTARRASGGARVRRVQLAVARRVAGGRCRFLTRGGRFGRPRACGRRVWVAARGTRGWKLRIAARLPRGDYLVAARADDARRLRSVVRVRRTRVG
ncbi:CocE/NonD family hydrolase [Patulibacter defluvii]|uniref:CocE/NonD family hydrolase n=1 Tax=Patulibacter defluvii TaxID=3095358 RepID=UPI002A761163|nr:CocE/NonD family hydrolase [Patulibacter sp. DM4]